MSRKVKIFIDGSEGTTGLRIHERFAEREDVELLPISSELRKDKEERKRLINSSDIAGCFGYALAGWPDGRPGWAGPR